MKLNDVCEVITCGVAKRPEYVEDGIPFLSSKNVKEDRFILDHYNYVSNEDYLKLTKNNKPEKGDVLYTRVGSFGQAAVVDFDFYFAVFVSLTLIKPKKEIVDSRYLMHYLNNPFIRNLANNSTSGIGVQNLNVKVVREFPIELPPLKTQKRIAQILDDAAALRHKTKQLLKEYDLLAQSIFLEMFGDLVNNQKSWEKVKFKEIFTSIRYGTGSPPIYQVNGIPFIRATNVKNGYIEEKGLVYISEKEASKIEKCRLKEGDLIIVRSGANTGDCSRIPKKYVNAFGGFDLIIEIEEPHSIFINFLLNTNAAKAILGPLTRRAGQPHINSRQLSELELINPPIKLQNQFAEKIALIEQQKKLAKQELQESEDLFNCLLQKAFKGELFS